MNMTLTNAANLSLGGGSIYVSPEAKVTEIHTEGVLCTSGQIEQWIDGESFTWDE